MIIKIYKLIETREPAYEIEIDNEEIITLLFRLEKSGFIERGIRQE